MKPNHNSHLRGQRKGFTLIEMLVVIAVISVLAGMLFPITKAVNRNKVRARARAELALLQTAIEAYKLKLGFYPPDNPNTNSPLNQLYYELLGTTFITAATRAGAYQTLDGSAIISPADANTAFGVQGFANSTKGGGDEGQSAVNFLKGIKPNQVAEISQLPFGKQTTSKVRLLVGTPWPNNFPYQVLPADRMVNPWRYNSSSPRYNPGSFDLWIDLILDGKTNRIGNWSREPIINPR